MKQLINITDKPADNITNNMANPRTNTYIITHVMGTANNTAYAHAIRIPHTHT